MTEVAEPAVETAPRRSAALVDPGLVEAARILRASLVRVYPSFRFEERLAGRLADLAARPNDPARVGPGRERGPIPFPVAWQPAARLPRRVVIGGVIASGVSIAGAAYLARRWLTRGA